MNSESRIAVDKAELLKVGIFFPSQFPSPGFFSNKKVGNRKKLFHICQ